MRAAFAAAARSTAVQAWLASRLVVLLALAVSRVAGGAGRPELLDWDAAWYADIAEHGYAADGAIRFFPLWPPTARAVSANTFLPVPVVLIGLTNALTLMMLVAARCVAHDARLPPAAVDLVPLAGRLRPGRVR